MENVSKLPNISAAKALDALNQAWAYYTPEPLPASVLDQKQPELFQYHDAA